MGSPEAADSSCNCTTCCYLSRFPGNTLYLPGISNDSSTRENKSHEGRERLRIISEHEHWILSDNQKLGKAEGPYVVQTNRLVVSHPTEKAICDCNGPISLPSGRQYRTFRKQKEQTARHVIFPFLPQMRPPTSAYPTRGKWMWKRATRRDIWGEIAHPPSGPGEASNVQPSTRSKE